MASSISGAGGVLMPTALPAPTSGEDPRKIADAAQQFEALMIGQMLKSMHESDDGGWTGTDNDDAGSQAVELAEDHLAQAMAHQGGLGLAQLLARGLTRASAAENPQAADQKLQP